MGLETRKRKSLEKSDLDSFSEINWNKQANTQEKDRLEELQKLKNFINSLEEEIFSEQDVEKATENINFYQKEDAKTYEDFSNEELLNRVNNLFK